MYSVRSGGGCQANDEGISSGTGGTCSENEALRILGQFEEVYRSRIAEVEADGHVAEPQRNELKLKIMNDWVKDLGDQNAMLVQTVHDLEKAAVCKVKLLQDKLQETSVTISHNILSSEKSEDDLKALSDRVCNLVDHQTDLEDRIKNLQCDIYSLLELIKRGRLENNWSLNGVKFYEIQPSDIPTPENCTCDQISKYNKEEAKCDERDLEIQNLREQLYEAEKKREQNMHEYEHKINNVLKIYKDKCQEVNCLTARHACLEKESLESRNALTEEVADKHDRIRASKNHITQLEEQLCQSSVTIRLKDELIRGLKDELKAIKKAPQPIRKVRISTEPCEKSEIKTTEDKLNDAKKQLEEFKRLLSLKEDEISKLKSLQEKSNQVTFITDRDSSKGFFIENDIVNYLMSLRASMAKDSETILSLKLEYETVLETLNQSKDTEKKKFSINK